MHKKFLFLFCTLLIFILAYPFIEKADNVLEIGLLIFSTLVPVATIYAIGTTRTQLELALSFGVPFLFSIWFYAATQLDLWIYVMGGLAVAFYIFAIGAILHRIYHLQKVNATVIFAALSVYLLMGIGWSQVYFALYHLQPGSFVGAFVWSDFLYYSFSTLTTLGVGDIVPVSQFARMLTSLQAVSGVLYIAVLVAQFVGMYSHEAAKQVVKELPEKPKRKTTRRRATPQKKAKRKTTSKKKSTTKKKTSTNKPRTKKTTTS